MTDTTQVQPTTQAPQERPRYTRLSTLLRDIPPNECCLVVEGYEAAVLKGVLRAVPLAGEHFGKVVQLEGGEKKRFTLQDELVQLDEQGQAWLTEQRRESRYRVLGHVGKVETTLERLKAGDDAFERLLEIRRRRLKAGAGGGKGGAP